MIHEYLEDVLRRVAPDGSGHRAGYIPQLANADPERLSAAFAMVDGQVYAAGDDELEFSIQSISKPFAYALALQDRGLDTVLAKVGVEPSGEAFNELSLEGGSRRPLNPMINAGAIATYSLVGAPGINPEERLERAVSGLSAFAGRRLSVDDRVRESELEHAHRNLAIGHMLRSYGILDEDPAAVVVGYTHQCSMLVSVRDLALMAATLANRGVQPITGEQVVSPLVARQVLSVMSTCGMYDAAGDWATRVGIPAKSGVAGGLIGALPGQIGVATFSPRLDTHGNSVRGVSMFERFTSDMGMHLMDAPVEARSVIRGQRVLEGDRGSVRVIELQGSIRFAGVERVLRDAVGSTDQESSVVLDVSRVYGVDEVASKMILEALHRLREADHDPILVDPEGLLLQLRPASATSFAVVSSMGEALSGT